MECTLLEKDKTRVTLLIKDANPSFVNALRRAIMERIPVMAMEDIEIRKNSSILYDEIIAHRLGLIPLKTDLKTYNYRHQCKCDGEGCARCTVQLSLSAKGPGMIYAKDFTSKDPKIIPVYGEMPIVKLHKGQEIELVATAILGNGQEHAKWSAGLAWHAYEPKITITQNAKKLEEYKNLYPPQIFDKEGKIDKKAITDLNLIDACDGVCDDLIKVEYNNKNFLFIIEPWGQLSPKEMMVAALDHLQEQLASFQQALQESK
ncbi:DNA-directed RNA polymerase subunit D [Candidatus Woesearchaeota archaeon]|nr:DNA-directed RNA polymerase subunit D [Candidatus Woesearchaeota archaeon]